MRTAAKLRKGLSWHQTLLRFFVLLFVLSSSQAALVNRTIDDSFGDSSTGFRPIYTPSSGRWEDQTCSGCLIQPDRSQAHDGTWTAATYNPQVQNMSITLQFTGVAVWVFFILANANENGPITTNTNCNFTLDGSHAGTFVHNPDMNTFYLVYNALAFSATGLSNTRHQLIISTNDVPFNVFVNFDYAVYTAVTTDPSTTAVVVTPPTTTAITVLTVQSSSTSTTSGLSSNSATTSTFNSTAGQRSPATPSLSTSTSSNSSSTDVSPGNTGNGQANSSASHSVATTVGAVFGGLAVIIIAFLLFLIMRIKAKKATSITPAPLETPNRPQTQVFLDTMSSHLPWESTLHSEQTVDPFMHVTAGMAAGTNSESSYSRSASDYNDTTPLNPVRRADQVHFFTDTKNREDIRAIRQMEIDQQLQSAQREMENLTARQSMLPPPTVNPTNQEMEQLREQVRLLTGQIDHLQRERHSDWALGLSDEPPPAYAR